MDELCPTTCMMVSANDVEKTRAWTDCNNYYLQQTSIQ